MLKCQTYRNPQREVKTHLCFNQTLIRLQGCLGYPKFGKGMMNLEIVIKCVVYHPPQIEQKQIPINFDVLVNVFLIFINFGRMLTAKFLFLNFSDFSQFFDTPDTPRWVSVFSDTET